MRRILLFAVVSAVLAVAGCAAPPPPQVSFFADGTTIQVEPTQYCTSGGQECKGNPKAPGTLRIPTGKPLQISVPVEVADATWAAVFQYRDSSGAVQDGRTQVFPAGSQHAYTLTMPAPTDQLIEVQVQRIANIVPDPAGGIAFATDASWVLEVNS